MTALPTSSTTNQVTMENTGRENLIPQLPSSVITTFISSTCLFCSNHSQNIDENLLHMSKSHNFFIPDPDHLIDISSFLGFLTTIISDFHECLFCGTARSNKWAIQDHMKSKGHCRIDLEDEDEEWANFWDHPSDAEIEAPGDEGVNKKVADDNEMRLPSGKTLGHRSRTRHFRHSQNRSPPPSSPSRQLQSNTTGSNPKNEAQPSASSSSDRRLTLRAGTSTSLIGIPELQQWALRATEKKTLQLETRARNRYQAGLERAGNSQKHFKVLRRLERVPGSV